MGFFDAIKQAKQMMQMQGEAKKLQAEMAKVTASYTNAGITVVARGDMTVVSVKFTPDALEEVKAGKTDRFETMLANVVNGAFRNVQQSMQAQVQEMLKAQGGLPGMQ